MKENIVVGVFALMVLSFGGLGIIDCICNIVQHWNISIPAIFDNLTLGYILRIIWWFFSFYIGAAVICGLCDDKSDL